MTRCWAVRNASVMILVSLMVTLCVMLRLGSVRVSLLMAVAVVTSVLSVTMASRTVRNVAATAKE